MWLLVCLSGYLVYHLAQTGLVVAAAASLHAAWAAMIGLVSLLNPLRAPARARAAVGYLRRP